MKKLFLFIFISMFSVFLVSCGKETIQPVENIKYIDLYAEHLPERIEIVGGERTIVRLHTPNYHLTSLIKLITPNELTGGHNRVETYFFEHNVDGYLPGYQANEIYETEIDIKEGEHKIYDVSNNYEEISVKDSSQDFVYECPRTIHKGLNKLRIRYCVSGYSGYYLQCGTNNLYKIYAENEDIEILEGDYNGYYYLKDHEIADIYIYNHGERTNYFNIKFDRHEIDEVIESSNEYNIEVNDISFIEFETSGWYKVTGDSEFEILMSKDQFQTKRDDLTKETYIYVDCNFWEGGDYPDRFIVVDAKNENSNITISRVLNEKVLRYFSLFDKIELGEKIEGYFYPGMQVLFPVESFSTVMETAISVEMTYGLTYRFVTTSYGVHYLLLIEFTDPNREGEFFFTIKE